MVAGLAALVALFSALWLASLKLRNSSIADIWWGPGFLLATIVYLLTRNGFSTRGWLVTAFVALWGLRLAWHIGTRNIGHGEDFRYRAWREQHGRSWWWRSYVQVFLLQALIAWVASWPVYYAMQPDAPPAMTLLDAIGAGLFAVGFVFEAVGDEQLRRFKQNPANEGFVMRTGLWRYTRHPNYFGEALVWWGIGLIGVATPSGAIGLAGPALITFLLLRVSGVAMLEKSLTKTKAGYAEYIATTSSFIPRPPRIG